MAEDEEEYGVEFSHHAGLVSPTAAAACEGLTTLSFDVTPGRRRTSLLRGFTETIVESARQQQRAQDSFERGRVRRAVYILQRGGYVKKKGEQAKEYKQRFCFLAGDCCALLMAKSHRSKDRAKALAVFSPIGGGAALPVQAQRGPPRLKHKRDAETPGFAAATFSLRVPTVAPAIGGAGASSSGSLGGDLGSNNGTKTLPSAPASSATVTVATTDLWLPSEGECEEWLRALQVVAAAWANPAQGPRELVWDAQAGGGGWVEGPRHYIEALAEDLARSSLVAYLEAQARRLRRRTVRRSLNNHHHSGSSNRNSAALTQSRLGVAVAPATTTLQGGAGRDHGHGHTHLHRMNAVLAAKAAAMRARVNANAAARRDRGVGGVGVGPGRGGQGAGPQALVDMARFHAVPIKRAFHHVELPTEALQAQALRAFRLVMQYMGDLPPEEVEGQEGGAATAGTGAAGDDSGNEEGHCGSGAVSRHLQHPHTRLQRVQSQSQRLFSGLTGGGHSHSLHPLLSPPSPLVRPPSGEGSGTEEDGGGSPQQAALLQQLLRLGHEVGELRNELYAAAIAQTTENPSPASVLRGWQLLAAFSRAFPPRDEELRDVAILHADRAATCCCGFQQQFALAGAGEPAGNRNSHSSSHDNSSSRAGAASGTASRVAALAHHAYEALLHSAAIAAAASSPDGWPTTAATAQAQPSPTAPAAGTALLSLREVVALQKLTVPPSVFGCTLEEVLRKELVLVRATHGAAAAHHHSSSHRNSGSGAIGLPPAGALVEQGNVPLVLQTLVRRFQELNGYEVEGVFRRAAHTDAVAAARRRLEDGAYVVYGPAAVGTDDPLVVADLIKIWLRLLAPEPLIPSWCYAAALDAGQHSGDVRPVARLLREGLPAANAATLQYLVQFLNHCAELAPVNQMTPTNLTIVFSPNLLRHPSNDPLRMVQNAESERRFVALLMEAVRRGLDAVASGDSPRSGRRSPREGSSPTGASGGGGKKNGYGRKLTRLIFGAR